MKRNYIAGQGKKKGMGEWEMYFRTVGAIGTKSPQHIILFS
jgi:hypothetical protein